MVEVFFPYIRSLSGLYNTAANSKLRFEISSSQEECRRLDAKKDQGIFHMKPVLKLQMAIDVIDQHSDSLRVIPINRMVLREWCHKT